MPLNMYLIITVLQVGEDYNIYIYIKLKITDTRKSVLLSIGLQS